MKLIVSNYFRKQSSHKTKEQKNQKNWTHTIRKRQSWMAKNVSYCKMAKSQLIILLQDLIQCPKRQYFIHCSVHRVFFSFDWISSQKFFFIATTIVANSLYNHILQEKYKRQMGLIKEWGMSCEINHKSTEHELSAEGVYLCGKISVWKKYWFAFNKLNEHILPGCVKQDVRLHVLKDVEMRQSAETMKWWLVCPLLK